MNVIMNSTKARARIWAFDSLSLMGLMSKKHGTCSELHRNVP